MCTALRRGKPLYSAPTKPRAVQCRLCYQWSNLKFRKIWVVIFRTWLHRQGYKSIQLADCIRHILPAPLSGFPATVVEPEASSRLKGQEILKPPVLDASISLNHTVWPSFSQSCLHFGFLWLIKSTLIVFFFKARFYGLYSLCKLTNWHYFILHNLFFLLPLCIIYSVLYYFAQFILLIRRQGKEWCKIVKPCSLASQIQQLLWFLTFFWASSTWPWGTDTFWKKCWNFELLNSVANSSFSAFFAIW